MIDSPPKFWTAFFRKLCSDDCYEELQGDLEERFFENARQHGIAKARRIYKGEVLKMIRPSVWKTVTKKEGSSLSPILLRSHFKVLIRNLRRQWAFSLINIFGLAFSMATGILVLTMLFELQRFDDFHDSPEDIFRVITHRNINGQITPLAASPAVLSDAMLEELPQVKAATRLNVFYKKAGRSKYKFDIKGLYADTSFFDVFTFNIIQGDPLSLNNPGSVFVTQTLARKLFRETDPIGQKLTIEDVGEFLIQAIIEDLPKHTHLQFEVLIPYNNSGAPTDNTRAIQSWSDVSSVITYVRKEPNSRIHDIQTWLDTKSEAQYETAKIKAAFELQPLQQAITGQELSHQPGTVIPSIVIYILTGVAIAIMLAGCFNYTNLSIARALSRMKEVGVRKTVGSSKLQIFLHYLSETVLLAILAFGLAILVFLLIRPYFLRVFWMMESLFDLQLTLPMVLRSFVFSVLVGILAGLYPALIYSKINPVSALKGRATVKLTLKKYLRNGLIIVQFSLVFAFILISWVSKKQYSFMDKMDKGFDIKGLISMPIKENSPELLSSAFMSIPGVEHVNFTSASFGGTINKTLIINPEKNDTLNIREVTASEDFLATYKIELIAGSALDPARKSTNSILINKRLASYLTDGKPTNAIGQELIIHGNQQFITGVTEDFMFGSQQDRIAPLIISRQPEVFQYATIRFSKTIDSDFYGDLENAWKSVDSQNIIEPITLEARYAGNIQFLREVVRATGYIGISLIIISGLGLLAIIGYQIQLRMKDLSLRRILGARPAQLLASISVSFMILLSVAAVIGISAGYFLLDNSLIATFYYRIDIGLPEMLPSIVFVFIISGSFIISQVLKVVRINPTESLRPG